MADLVAGWSKDRSTKVGAVLVDERKRVAGVGYNGFPDRIMDHSDLLDDRDMKLSLTIHAEVNAILNCAVPTKGLNLFVTHPPCGECSKFVIQAGISKVFYWVPEGSFLERWQGSIDRAEHMFGLAGVPLLGVQRVA